ncbi:invasion protein IalB [Rhodovulum imhoffii]|uniref:Invasion protein IalB n=1 Tax=Rhodovulum imhoffii TaxID=365340 RepID=A0A2T5BTI0_9RHOB|nr:invasion associated locus B family protein [Rhodovulum imhoffii]MBK5934314.1 hypothetical protein [Rhodovulum imhoffii]PTN02736.1 invasion protein IalB [Rhodovulum imhoffii]
MRDFFKTLTCAAALLATPALSQDTTETDSGLAMGTEDAQVGETYVRETFGDWALRCVRAPEDQPDPCQLYQLLNDDEGNPVAEMSIFPLPDGSNGQAAAGATIITPLETLLTEQLRLSVDSGAAKVYPFSWCSQVGCFARVGFTAEDVNAFKRGSAAKLVIVPVAAPDQKVGLGVSLKGFTAGYEALSSAATAPKPPAPETTE